MDGITLGEERVEREVGVGRTLSYGSPVWNGLEEATTEGEKQEHKVSWEPGKSVSGRWWVTVSKRHR